ncbi:hypothetical protein CLM82_30415 [Streptomyces albidoflavus]|nr:hypothetical protein CLM82_30415 [Streptomyces albidoflavus]
MNTYWLEHAWLGDRVENGVVVDLVPPDAPGPVPVDEELGDGTRAPFARADAASRLRDSPVVSRTGPIRP